MNEDLVREIFDAFWHAKKALESMPPLPPGFKPSHLRVLEVVYQKEKTGEAVCVSDVSEKMKITKPNITKLVNELCSLKAVSKSTSIKDRRVIFLTLTPFGLACVDHYIIGHHDELAKAFSALDVDTCQTMIERIHDVAKIMIAMNKYEERQHNANFAGGLYLEKK